MRVLAVSHSRIVFGAERVLLDLAARLRGRGIAFDLASPIGAFADAWSDAGLTHVPLAAPEHHGIRTEHGMRPSPWALAREAGVVARWTSDLARQARGYDLLYSNSLWAHLETAVAARTAQRRSVLHVHDLVAPGAGQQILGIAARLSSATVAISQAVADCVPPSGREHVHVVWNGVDLGRFSPGPVEAAVRADLTERPSHPLVGIVGRMDPEKGIDTVIEAVAALPDDAHLVVVGEPSPGNEDHAAHLRAFGEARLGGRVRFTGRRDAVPEVLRSLDILVNASDAEPFGLSILEAQACGTPVVATDAAGARELVRDSESGLLVKPGDAAALTHALGRLLADRDLARRLARSARSAVEDRFGLERQVASIAALLVSAVGREEQAA